MNYYVYYKVDAAKLPLLQASIRSLFLKTEKQFGIRGRWMRRRDDPSTYMEVYDNVADGAAFDAFLERETKSFPAERRIERFISAETPA